ncbi:MAG: SDR family oxidoreductase [Gammaproteobacteria bacterium]|nr:SDR family oxidoreductase [Gammaproteobacteria bacterium]
MVNAGPDPPVGEARPVAIVTGASSGIGEAAALALAAAGFRVALTARRAARLRALADRINARAVGPGGEAQGSRESAGGLAPSVVLPADVTRRHEMEAVVSGTLENFGRIDVLVNNAGIMRLAALRKVDVGDWERTVDVNVKGVLFAIGAVLPVFLRQGSGHFVNVSSLAGRRPFPNGTVYSATKFAVRAISEGLRGELSADTGIRVTDVGPGVVETELLDGTYDREARERFEGYWAGRRRLDARDVASAIVYAVTAPPHVNVNEMLIRPTDQKT